MLEASSMGATGVSRTRGFPVDIVSGAPEPDRITRTDRVLGVFVLVAGIAIVVAARTTATLLPAFSIVALGVSFLEATSLRGIRDVDLPTSLVAAFLGLALVSAAWAVDARETFFHVLVFLFLLAQWQLVRTWVLAQPIRRVRHLAYWFAIATAIGVAILAFEVWGHQYIRRIFIEKFDVLTPPALNKHYRIDAAGNLEIFGFELNRSIAAANMMFWPALLCAASHWSGRTFVAIAAVLAGGVALATFGSNHETSKLSFIAGAVIFAVASFRPRFAAGTLAGVWTALILGIVPASLVAYQSLDLQTSSWLQNSARQRIVIWNDISERVKLSPWFGVGARTAYVLSEESVKELKDGRRETRAIARHAHNVYLQTWFELGLAGAVIMLVGGLAALWGAMQAPASAQPYVLSSIGVFFAEIGSSWEIWQRWFFALFVLAAVFTLLGVRSAKSEPQHPAAS
jgi:hypothetical protein